MHLYLRKMDIDDEDAFLYGDSEPIDSNPSAGPGGAVNDVVKTEEAKQNAQCEFRIPLSFDASLARVLIITMSPS